MPTIFGKNQHVIYGGWYSYFSNKLNTFNIIVISNTNVF
nr:MAG TPA: hypothetical protein [Caudoviricetes sp.]